MMRTLSITSLLVLAVACGACGPARPPVTPEPAAEPVTELPAPGRPLWPASAPRVQVLLSSAPDGARVWVVSDGTNLIAVYHVASADLADAQARIASAHPLLIVILHPGSAPPTPPSPPASGSVAISLPACPPGVPCMYVPGSPPANGPIVPPNVVQLVLRFTSVLDAIHRAWLSAPTATPAGAAQ
jgi:hypothetical protein